MAAYIGLINRTARVHRCRKDRHIRLARRLRHRSEVRRPSFGRVLADKRSRLGIHRSFRHNRQRRRLDPRTGARTPRIDP